MTQIIKITEASYHSEMPLLLTGIAHSAKSYWGYPQAWLDSWKDDLTVTQNELLANSTFIIQEAEDIVGFAMLMKTEPCHSIEHFWIKPDYIGKGFGKKLMHYLLNQEEVKESIIQALADPYAEAFYQKSGFVKIADIPSSIPGRSLPLMQIQID